MAGLLDKYAGKKLERFEKPRGLLNAVADKVKERAVYASGLLDPDSPISRDAQAWHKRTQAGLKDFTEGKNTEAADYGYAQLMNMVGLAPLGMTVWHGSPHKFDKFDMSKIGTGEGAQAYGHGLYTAESQGVGKSYRDALTTGMNKYLLDGQPAGQQPIESQWLVENYVTALKRNNGDAAAAIKELQSESARTLEKATVNLQEVQQNLGKTVDMGEDWGDLRNFTYTQDDLKSAIDSVNRAKEYTARISSLTPERIAESPGYLYKVDIPDEAVARFLDWDKPLSQQAPEVQKAIRNSPIGNRPDIDSLSGNSLHDLLMFDAQDKVTAQTGKARNGSQQNAVSAYLQSQGIPGIRYLDGGSRSAGQGSSNFVLFDDQLPRILEINGQATGNVPWQPNEWRGLLNP